MKVKAWIGFRLMLGLGSDIWLQRLRSRNGYGKCMSREVLTEIEVLMCVCVDREVMEYMLYEGLEGS